MVGSRESEEVPMASETEEGSMEADETAGLTARSEGAARLTRKRRSRERGSSADRGAPDVSLADGSGSLPWSSMRVWMRLRRCIGLRPVAVD